MVIEVPYRSPCVITSYSIHYTKLYELGIQIPEVVTTVYVHDDKDANCADIAAQVGALV